MQDYKLKPCPFCGGRKIELVEPEYFSAVGFANALRVDKPLQQEKRQRKRRKSGIAVRRSGFPWIRCCR